MPPDLARHAQVAAFRKSMPTTQLLDRRAGVGLRQENDDLLACVSLLHVQSPRLR